MDKADPGYPPANDAKTPGQAAGVPMQPPGQVAAVAQQPIALPTRGPVPKGRLDQATMDLLSNSHKFGLYQGNGLVEALTGGCCANIYVFVNKEVQVPVQGRQDTAEQPIFVLEEESSCCCRLCCPGNYPATVKYYNAFAPTAGKTMCGRYSGHSYVPNKAGGAVMTFERDGCCTKCHGCFICPCCPDMCREEAFLIGGDTAELGGGKVGKYHQNSNANVLGRSHTPVDGGCFTPTLDIFNHVNDPNQAIGHAEGPCCFGGCADFCMDVNFPLSKSKGKVGDIGYVKKIRPEGCMGVCLACSTDVDNYEIETQGIADPVERALLLNTALHLDYAFFEADNNFCDIQDNGDGSGVIYINLFTWYIRGYLMPIYFCIPYGQDG